MHIELDIRVATVADVPAMLDLINAAYRAGGSESGWTSEHLLVSGNRSSAAELQAYLTDSQRILFLAMRHAELVGCVMLKAEGRAAYLGLLAILPRHQNQGFGSVLLDYAEAYAQRQLGAKAIQISVIRQRPELIAYYQRRGYRLTGHSEAYPEHLNFGNPTQELQVESLEKLLTEGV